MSRGPLVLGDLGHSLFRLSRARATSRAVGFDVKEVLYPGFEGRPEAESFDAFMESVEMQVDVYRLSHSRPLIYATGFGALVLLALRARAKVPDLPSVVQGAVPWETVRRRGGDRDAGAALRERMRDAAHQESFTRAHLHSPLDADERRSFFSGYASCDAIPALWDWLDAGWLASLEGALAARPPAVDDVRVWICGEDDLVAEDEHDAAVRALGAEWPVERAETWGHFPYLDDPGPWVGALQAMGV
ncbi:MAG: hypothetical protein VX015_09580 [Planctomycetota bacterium]|nr:hypothetical protein [Planctomycetota bacterium]